MIAVPETVKVECPSQPNLLIPSLNVQFVDGVAEVPAGRVEALAAYRVHGVVLPGDKPASATPSHAPQKKVPRKTSGRKPAGRKPFG